MTLQLSLKTRRVLSEADLKRPADDALLAQTAKAAHAGEYEQYKTTKRFDGTAHHPQWLETARLR